MAKRRSDGGNADRGEAGMARGRIGAAVVHGRADRDARGHLVVEQAADLLPQPRGELIVGRIVAAAGVRIDAAGEIAFELLDDRGRPVDVVGDHHQRGIAESFGLQGFGRFEELLAADAQQRVGVAIALARRRFAADERVSAGANQRR